MGNAGLKQHYMTASKTGVLQISDSKLKELPEEVLSLKENLRNLDLSKNRLTHLPEVLSDFKQLKHLNVEQNKIECILESISKLNKLEYFNASSNLITSLPHEFGMLTNLKQVYLNNNKIKKFPKQLLNIKTIDVIELANNKITEIPCGMNNLFATELNLSQNEITVLGDDLHMAPRLKILRLDENCLSLDAIRPSLLKNSKAHTIHLEGNLFEMKQLTSLEGYNEYTERYTAVKKKMF